MILVYKHRECEKIKAMISFDKVVNSKLEYIVSRLQL